MLYHTALNCFRTPADGLTAEQLLEQYQQSSKDLCSMLLEYFGKHIVEPSRDLFEKATKMKVSQSSGTCFLTQVEASARWRPASRSSSSRPMPMWLTDTTVRTSGPRTRRVVLPPPHSMPATGRCDLYKKVWRENLKLSALHLKALQAMLIDWTSPP